MRTRAALAACLAGSHLEETARQTSDTLPLSLLLATLGGTLIALQTGYQFQG